MRYNFRILIFGLFSVVIFILISAIADSKESKDLKVSLPEEICLAKKGDILIVESVSDSIYIGFKHYHLEWKIYALDLEEQGYTKQASEHIAKVEFNIIPIDQEYISLMED